MVELLHLFAENGLVDSEDKPREPAVGRSSHPRRTPQTLIAGQLHQIWGVKPPRATRFVSGFGFRPQLVADLAETLHVDPPTYDRPETASTGLFPQIAAVVDGAGKHALAG